MRLTTRGRFAVTAMMDIAMRQNCGPVALAGIAQRHSISQTYLEQLFGKLRRNNLVTSTRGPSGGYTLARSLSDVSIASIIHAVGEPIEATNCGGKGDCNYGQPCMTHDLWMGLNSHMEEYLDSVSLLNMVQQQNKRRSADNKISSVLSYGI